jgi:hypothetical protein
MKTSTYTLFEQLGLVFETHCPDQYFFLGEESGGRRVGETAPDLAEMVVSLRFVLPPLATEAGTYNVITVSRGTEVAGSPQGESSDLDLQARYEAVNGRFTVRLGAGERTSREIVLEGFPPAAVAQRVLRLLVLLNGELLYASLDSEDGPADLAVYGDAPSCGAALDPWGTPAAGLWRVTSGADPWCGEPAPLAFPPGFGLSDVQVLVLGDRARGDRHLLYSGALDHLTGWHSKCAALRRTERLFDEELTGLAGELHGLAAELESWARRTHVAADRAEALSQLPPSVCRSLRQRALDAAADV